MPTAACSAAAANWCRRTTSASPGAAATETDLKAWDTQAGRVGALVCYEHTNPLFRYAVQSLGEQIHIANWPGGMPWTYDLIDACIRSYAIESAAFVVSCSALVDDGVARFLGEEAAAKLQRGGGSTAIVAPGGKVLARAQPDREELLCHELDFGLIADWKHVVDGCGHYARPDVLQLRVNDLPQRGVEFASRQAPTAK